MTTRFREFLCATTMLVGFALITADAADARPKGIGISRSMMVPSMRAPSIRPRVSMRMRQVQPPVRTFAPRLVMMPRRVVMPGPSLPKGLYQPNIPRLNGIPAAALPIGARFANAKGNNVATGNGPRIVAGAVGAAGANVVPRTGNGAPPTAQNGPHISIAAGLQEYIKASGGNPGWISTLPGRDGKLNLPPAATDRLPGGLGTGGRGAPSNPLDNLPFGTNPTEQPKAADIVAGTLGRPGSPTHGRVNDRSGQAATGKWSTTESHTWVIGGHVSVQTIEYNKEEGRTRETWVRTTPEGTTTTVHTRGDEDSAPQSYSEHHEPANGGNGGNGSGGSGSGNKPDSQPNDAGRYTGPIYCPPGHPCKPTDPRDMLPGPGGMPRDGQTGVPVAEHRTSPGPGAATDPCPDCDPSRGPSGGGSGNGRGGGPNPGSSDVGWRPDKGGMVNPNGTLVNGGPVIPGGGAGPVGPGSPPR
jgi:hypothetical protein